MLAQACQILIRQQLPITQVAAGAEVILRELNVLAHGVERLKALSHHLGADSVASNNCDLHVVCHLSSH